MPAPPPRRCADVTPAKRLRILSFLLQRTANGVLSREAIAQATLEFGRSRGVIVKIYALRNASSLESKRKGRCGRPKEHDTQNI